MFYQITDNTRPKIVIGFSPDITDILLLFSDMNCSTTKWFSKTATFPAERVKNLKRTMFEPGKPTSVLINS